MAEKDLRIVTKGQGVQVVSVDATLVAGVNPSIAFVFATPFAATPRILGAPARVDAAAAENFSVQVTSLTKTGGTLRVLGTTTVDHIYFMSFIGDTNNPTAY